MIDCPKGEGRDILHLRQHGFASSYFVSECQWFLLYLEILVVMPNTWKKEVFPDLRLVLWTGTVTSHRAMGTSMGSSRHLISQRHAPNFRKILLGEHKAHISPDMRQLFLGVGLFSRCPQVAFSIMVFLPIRATAFPQRDMRICCICLEPKMSAPTVKHFEQSSKSWMISRKQVDFQFVLSFLGIMVVCQGLPLRV